MTINSTHQLAKRLGYKLRRAAAWVGRVQSRFIKWQVNKGIPFKVAKLLVMLLNIAAFALFVYLFAWVFAGIALLIALAVKLADDKTAYVHNDEGFETFNPFSMNNNNDVEWRTGSAEYGLYNKYDWRLDQHDPNAPEDDVI